ncbi:hypothetical protein EXIGLDRAFT_776709 [Exidia glandulosa HHB12029]|uniref:F-box domain-containing protein n=1 Tax=Exidia glandulosa HHB12029 TaxID=1314781 RepID=A0A165DDE3_EXIGL|nr:hypothetical protein EXIGLDRAFT_776709 [Exidia glandulosa HHB12029]
MSTSATMDLVDDILSEVYDHIDIYDLVRLRVVSRRWDAIVMDHPNYWRDLFLRARRPGAISFFLLRLSASRQRPVDVCVSFDDEEAAVAQLSEHYSAVYHAIHSHMGHIESLHLHGPVHHHPDIFAVIRHAAPLLKTLDINFFVRPRSESLQQQDISRLTLPDDLLANCAPLLRTFGLHNVTVGARTPPCIAHVTTASITHSHDIYIELPYLPTWFPSATTLTIAGNIVIASGGPTVERTWNAIVDLTLHGAAVRWHMRSLASYGPRITYFDWDLQILEHAHQRLRGTLALDVDATRVGWIRAYFESTVDGLRRSFRKQTGAWSGVRNPRGVTYDLPNILSYRPLMERVVFLSCTQHLLTHLTYRFTPMAALKVVVVVIGVRGRDSISEFLLDAGVQDGRTQKARLVCPGLESLVIRGDTTKVQESAKDAARAIVEMLDCPASLSVAYEGLEAGRAVLATMGFNK